MAITVADLDASVRFYEEGLGWKKTLKANVGGEEVEAGLGLPAGTTGRIQYLQGPTRIGQVELIEWSDGPGEQVRKGHRELGLFLLAFEVPREEIHQLRERLAKLGVDFMTDEVGHSELENYGLMEVFTCRDPDGNLLEFVSLPNREEIEAYRRETAGGEGRGDV